MRVPNPPDGQLLVSILRETQGTAVAVSKEEINEAQLAVGKHGISASPEGAATYAGLLRLVEKGWVGRNERVVLFNTSHALKYLALDSLRPVPVVKNYEEWQHIQQ
jgi:threonine synthase